MATKTRFKFKIDLSALNHLGLGLYTGTPAVLTEMVSNSWDADAKKVTITVDSAKDEIVIEDDGHGMNEDDVEKKFLTVSYSRRTDPKGRGMFSEGGRRVMGRKGIGKLAMFSLCRVVDITTKRVDAEAVRLRVNVERLRSEIEKGHDYLLEAGDARIPFKGKSGTRIRLLGILSTVDKGEQLLIRRLALRFAVVGRDDFKVSVNGHDVVPADRGFYDKIQFLWSFGGDRAKADLKSFKQIDKLPSGKRCVETLNGQIGKRRITGYIAAAYNPKDLKTPENNCNQISIFANGRVFQEDVLKQISNAKYFNSYLFGEIHADFLDGDKTDRAIANREALKQNDPLVRSLVAKLAKSLGHIEGQWDDWRRELGYGKSPGADPAVRQWLDELDIPAERKLAERLMLGIHNMPATRDETRDRETKKLLYQGTIAAFERLKVRKQLGELEKVPSVDSPQFMQLISSIDQLEETYFWDIVNNRLKVIDDFERNIIDKKALEKIAAKYLFNHLWLLDPSWERVAQSAEIEKTLTKYLKKEFPDEAARLDIAYRTTAGKHVIIELKRPGKTALRPSDLVEQATRYKLAAEAWFAEHSDTPFGRPVVEIFLLLEVDVFAKGGKDARDLYEKQLSAANTRVLTYQGLLKRAQMAYQDFLAKRPKKTAIEKLISKIQA
jgi:hypothetical protein